MKTTKQIDLREDEIKTLGVERCKNCEHLLSLHNYHCCEFCTVEDCDCEY